MTETEYCIKNAYAKLQQTVKDLPIKLTKFDQFINDFDKKDNLFLTFAKIFSYMDSKENLKLNKEIISEYQLLSMLIFITYYHYDKVLDDNNSKVLPLGNMLFRIFVKRCYMLKIDIDEAHNITELYNKTPNIIPFGNINMNKANKMNDEFHKVTDGFEVATVLVKDFANKYISNPSIDWESFWRCYLLDRQFSDDRLDYHEDMINDQLKSFGILALSTKFKNKKKVNLKNPIIFISFQKWIANNFELLEETYMTMFNNYIQSSNLNLELFYSFKMNL